MNEKETAKFMKKLGISDWHSSLSKESLVKLNRYMRLGFTKPPANATEFYRAVANKANKEGNNQFAAEMALEGLRHGKGEIRIFKLNEELIEALINLGASGSAKKFCHESLDMFPRLAEDLKSENSGCIPKDLKCRNRLIDILVGIEKDYEAGYAALDTFLDMGLITKEEWDYRRNSLKIHRLQRTFDGVYSLEPSRKD